MAIQTELFTLLSPLVGNRVHPNTALEKPYTTPYIVYSRISAVRENTLEQGGGSNALVQTNMQIDIYSKSYSEAMTISGQVQTSLRGWSNQNIVQMEQDFYEPDESVHRIMLEVSIWHR